MTRPRRSAPGHRALRALDLPGGFVVNPLWRKHGRRRAKLGRVEVWDKLEELAARGGPEEVLRALRHATSGPTREALGDGTLCAVEAYRCLRCKYVWVPYLAPPRIPRTCPSCLSYRWFIPPRYSARWKARWEEVQKALAAREAGWREALGEKAFEELLEGGWKDLLARVAQHRRSVKGGKASARTRPRDWHGRLLPGPPKPPGPGRGNYPRGAKREEPQGEGGKGG